MGQKSSLDFCIVLSDLFLELLDVGVKRGTEFSIDHHFVVCSLRKPKSWPNRKLRRSSNGLHYQMGDPDGQRCEKQFASSIATKF